MLDMGSLPEPLLEDVLGYLSIAERCRFLGSSRCLWAVKDLHEKRKRTLTIDREEDARLVPDLLTTWPRRMYQNFSHNLHILDLSFYCTDRFLEIISAGDLLPNLKHISMQRSPKVTDRGLRHLSMHTGRGIETIDITFCAKTSYGGTLCVRDRLRDSLRLLRRQPAWLDGKFHTPFRNEAGGEGEIHTYYADGSFSFNRARQSRGFVSNLYDWDDDGRYLADKMQYADFEPLPGWPTWSAYSYRPGVCLLQLSDEPFEGDETVRTVLVGQDLRELRPPRIRHVMEMEQLISMTIGSSVYFSKEPDGTFVRSGHGQPPDSGIMVTRMRVCPLDSLMPPEDLVKECQALCETMRDLGTEVIDRGEEYLLDQG